MSKYPQLNIRPSKLDQLILERLTALEILEEGSKEVDLVRYCIRFTAQQLLSEEDYTELVLHASKSL